MPIALPFGKTKLPERSSVASLCVTFTFPSPDNPLVYTDFPRGVFCRLAVELSQDHGHLFQRVQHVGRGGDCSW